MARDSGSTGRNSSLKQKSVEVGMKVVGKVLQDPDRARSMIEMVGKVQRSKEAFDDATHRLRNVGHLPSREDLARIGRHVGALRREVRRLKSRMSAIRTKLERA
ncbi:MAG: hypothetical protein ABIJ09_22020 [Pseudomonadota bacterium]